MASLCLQKLPVVEHLFGLTSFKLPEIPCSLSFQRHPKYMSITKESNEWAFKCMRRDFSPEEKKCMVQWKVPMFMCLSMPHAPKVNMVASAKFAWLTAFLDDPFDDNEVAGGALATSYLNTVLSLCYGTTSLAEVPESGHSCLSNVPRPDEGFEDKEDEFIFYCDILAMNASRNGKKAFLKFLDVLSCAIPANLVFHYASSRYHGMDNPLLGEGTFRGTWILDPKHTVIVSDPKCATWWQVQTNSTRSKIYQT
ncbi:hypothetical protein SELMODRAFT_428156 [Selaginella moellendorffii]|uniref:Terpene synthase n=1 Tax=Selaginella moellendorffii TaxID=88036 RepID=D8T1X8_SELML|nr:hypothetical protein SELMODRAFT_428156 [Selaginella moellendorffii]